MRQAAEILPYGDIDSGERSEVVIAIDPGRAKCGVAVVGRDNAIPYRAIVPTDRLPALIPELADRFTPRAILVGDGTGSSALLVRMPDESGPPVILVDERHTSERARALYLSENPARGWRRLIPRALRYPDSPYDDYVAVILAERWWQAQT